MVSPANHQPLNQIFSSHICHQKISQEGSWETHSLIPVMLKLFVVFLYLKVSLAEYRIIASLFSRLSLMYFSIVSGLKPCGQGPMSDFLSFKNDLVFLPGCPKRFFFPLWALCYQNMYWYCPFWAMFPICYIPFLQVDSRIFPRKVFFNLSDNVCSISLTSLSFSFFFRDSYIQISPAYIPYLDFLSNFLFSFSFLFFLLPFQYLFPLQCFLHCLFILTVLPVGFIFFYFLHLFLLF